MDFDEIFRNGYGVCQEWVIDLNLPMATSTLGSRFFLKNSPLILYHFEFFFLITQHMKYRISCNLLYPLAQINQGIMRDNMEGNLSRALRVVAINSD